MTVVIGKCYIPRETIKNLLFCGNAKQIVITLPHLPPIEVY